MQYMLVYMCGHMDWVFVAPNFVLFNCPSNSLPPDEGYGDLTVERQFSGGCSECCLERWEWGWWTTSYVLPLAGEEESKEGSGPAAEGRSPAAS